MSKEADIQMKAAEHFNAIVEQLDALRAVSTDCLVENDLHWSWCNVGSLSHIRNSLADILEGWERTGVKTNRAT